MSRPIGLRKRVVGRQQPDDEGFQRVGCDRRSGPKLHQHTLFHFLSVPTLGTHHERGLSKQAVDFQVTPQASIPWGDHLASGREVEDQGIFRVLSHNVNGLSKSDGHADVRNFAEAIAEKAVSVFGIQEPNRNFESTEMLTSFHGIIRSVSTHHHGTVSSAKLQLPGDYQPGGTAVSVRNQWATRFLGKGSDKFGRWSWLTLARRGTTKTSFISGYRVCDGANEAEITSRTFRAQQEWMYADSGIQNIDLRTQFVSDMVTLIKSFQAEGNDVVLMMDANEASRLNTGVDKLRMECELSDAHMLPRTTSPLPATYHRGRSKIDYVLVSKRLVPSIKVASILALHNGYLSDHRALVVDFDAARLFESQALPLYLHLNAALPLQNQRRCTSTSNTC